MKDLVVDEALIVSLDFNSRKPKMFSKYFDEIQPGFYSETVAEAIAASASAPMVFQPLQLTTKVGQLVQYLIDGGVVANNPSIYAYIVARYFNEVRPKAEDFRIMSLAAGNSKFTPITRAEQFGGKLKNFLYQGAGSMGTDIRLNNNYMKYFILPENQWLRLESNSSISLFAVDKKNV